MCCQIVWLQRALCIYRAYQLTTNLKHGVGWGHFITQVHSMEWQATNNQFVNMLYVLLAFCENENKFIISKIEE